MSDERLHVYIGRMLSAAEKVISYTREMQREAFLADQRTQDAVIANIMAIGECAIKVLERYPQFVAEHPQIAWIDIRNMRNRIAHQYFQLDVDTIWQTANQVMPEFIEQLESLRHWRPQGE